MNEGKNELLNQSLLYEILLIQHCILLLYPTSASIATSITQVAGSSTGGFVNQKLYYCEENIPKFSINKLLTTK